ncbi:OTU-like cysteine protease [Ancylostoma ceylanicum]|uniref:OTU-like cysteine protease n=1 Tax=Ancylostoma ceylanicum TaxID=53326 RepID=A0A0D6LRG7_9BILA|nr:OTU-like cysteine protease [Ancylostoma ceylanicum]
MDLYVRCTLEYLDTPSTKYFSGKFFVDSGEGSFTIVEYKPDGKKEERLHLGWLVPRPPLLWVCCEVVPIQLRALAQSTDSLFSSGQSSKKPPSVTGLTSAAPRNVTSQTSILMENSLDSCNNISQEPANILVQEIVRPSSSNDNDIIEIVNNEPSRSSASKTSKQSSVVDVRNGMNEGNAKSGSSELQSTENGKETSSAKSGLPSSRSKESSKEQQNQKSRRPSNADKSSQGSIITLVEQKSIESSTIRVSAPFKARSHTVTFKQKRTDSSPTKPSLSQQSQRRAGDIVSPRPQLLADSISSSRCLLSPPSGPKGLTSSSSYMNRDAVTPSRKRKEIDEPTSKSSADGDVSDNLSPTSADQQYSPYSYRGLENLTNSCYMNATLQALASVYPFYYRMQMIQQRREDGGYECSEFVRRFNEVLHNLVSPDRDKDSKYGSATKISVLQALRTAAGNELGSDPNFGSNMQQVRLVSVDWLKGRDAHEFLAKTLEILEKEALRKKRTLQQNNERTKSPHSEQSTSSASSSRNPAGVFQHKIRDSAGDSIQKMIENALAREEIEYKCDHCGTGAGFISRAFATLPQSLIVVVKRYRFGEAGGSKVEERIGVSRELFLKDLFVDSEVKKQEGVARRSLSRSVEPFIGDPREDGRSDDSGVISEAESVTNTEERTQNSRTCGSTVVANASMVMMDHEPAQECAFESSQGSDAMETCESARSTAESHITIDKHASADCSLTCTAVEKSRTPCSTKGSTTSHAELGDQPYGMSRLALSPLKMNRAASAKEDKLSDAFSSPRKLMVVENMDVDTSAATSSSECVLEDPEKENAMFNPLKLTPEVEGTVIKQSGGYLKETTPDVESARSGGSSTASREIADIPNDTGSASTQSDDNVLEKDVNSLKLTDNEDVPSKRARLENNIDAGITASFAYFPDFEIMNTTPPLASTEPSTSYARQVTEPLRPSSRTPKYRQPPTTPLLEQISVVGEVEEKVTLVFRPVVEERQKLWCQRFGFKYIGSPERRRKMFGREIEFSLRDMPQSCEVRGDGNCLFRTLSWWITGGSEKEYYRLREKLISFMAKYRANFSSLLLSQQDMDTHLERMSEDGEWGTQVELAAAACWLGVNIYTFLEGKWLRYRPLFRWSVDGATPITISRDECNDDRGAIFICNASGCHFQPAVSVEPHYTRRNLRPRREREFVKEASPVRGTPEPPYVFNAADGPVYSLSAVSEVEVIDNSSSSGYIFIYNRVEDPLHRL